jgi:hypothetical protein
VPRLAVPIAPELELAVDQEYDAGELGRGGNARAELVAELAVDQEYDASELGATAIARRSRSSPWSNASELGRGGARAELVAELAVDQEHDAGELGAAGKLLKRLRRVIGPRKQAYQLVDKGDRTRSSNCSQLTANQTTIAHMR